jgi:hypothetical protein
VPADAPLVLRLELDGCGDALRGRLATDSGWTMSFVGWVGLAAAIEQAVAEKMRGHPS